MNIPILRQIQAQIIAHPEQFNMSVWDCGTMFCISGWCNRITRRSIPASEQSGMIDLAIDAEQAMRLFYASCWPDKFRRALGIAEARTDFKSCAKIASARIEHFIETEGRE